MANRAPLLFGIVALLVGVGTGFLITSHPEGLNPSWPMAMALLVPAAFTIVGLQIVASGLGYSSVSAALLKAVAVCLWAIANWAAFFTARVPCRQTVSFFGVAWLERYPSEIECRNSLRGIIAFVDAVVVLFLAALLWRRRRGSIGAGVPE